MEATQDYNLTKKALEYFTYGINHLTEQYDIEMFKKGASATITSNIPLAVGFRSSAAICVATTKAFSELFDLNLDDHELAS